MNTIQGFLFKEANLSMERVSTYGGIQCVEGLLQLDTKNAISNQKVPLRTSGPES